MFMRAKNGYKEMIDEYILGSYQQCLQLVLSMYL